MTAHRAAPRAPLLLAAAAALTLSGWPARAMPRCDSGTPLTLIGVDTRAETALFALPRKSDAPGWLIEADFARGTATAWADERAAQRFGGSTGPGRVLAARSCGDRCLQVIAFRDGAWHRFGEPLLASPATNFHGTWDRDGAAWVVLHGATGGGGVAASAFLLQGRDWVGRGSLSVTGVGSPAAYPAPAGERGIVSGDAVLTAAEPPRRWLAALPADVTDGELVWLGGGQGLHLGSDGVLRRTADGGRRWLPLQWQPWAAGEGDLAWRAGRDYFVELPEGSREPPLLALWNDQRVASRPRLFVGRGGADPGWQLLLETPQGLLTGGGERLPYNHVLRFADRLVLLTGCVARAQGADLVWRPFAGGALADPRRAAVRVAAPARSP